MPLIRYCARRQYAKNHTQRGFSLPEALIAALFFSVSLLGLLQYHQALLQGFSSLWQQRQAWSVLNQHIDSGGDKPAKALISGIKPHWQYHQFIKRIDGECTEFSFTLKIQPRQQMELNRWFCNTSAGS